MNSSHWRNNIPSPTLPTHHHTSIITTMEKPVLRLFANSFQYSWSINVTVWILLWPCYNIYLVPSSNKMLYKIIDTCSFCMCMSVVIIPLFENCILTVCKILPDVQWIHLSELINVHCQRVNFTGSLSPHMSLLSSQSESGESELALILCWFSAFLILIFFFALFFVFAFSVSIANTLFPMGGNNDLGI